MHKIFFVNDKGGVGKSMTSYHFSATLAKYYGSTLLIDNDEQQSVNRLSLLAQAVLTQNHEHYLDLLEDYQENGSKGAEPVEPPSELNHQMLCMPVATEVSELTSIAQDFDFMVVDTPSGINRDLLASIMDSDSLVLVPCAARLTELWTTAEMMDAFADARATIRVIQRLESRERELTRDELKAANLYGRTMRTPLTTYKAYDETVQMGGSLVDIKPKATDRSLLKARNQMMNLTLEAVELLKEIEANSQGASYGNQPA